ncbi:hypothetical protein CR513_46847, partial [Mucuna pruriens]
MQVRSISYTKKLPPNSCIHPTFHVSQFKRFQEVKQVFFNGHTTLSKMQHEKNWKPCVNFTNFLTLRTRSFFTRRGVIIDQG